MILDVGCGEHPRGQINIDVVPTRYCNLVASAEYLPVKDLSITRLYLMNVLEHLKDPKKALLEANRVSIRDGIIEVVIAKNPTSSPQRHFLLSFFLNLPFSLFRSLYLIKARYNVMKRNPSQWFHYHFLKPSLVSKYLDIIRCQETDDIFLGFLNSGRKARYFKFKPRLFSLYHLTCKPKYSLQ